ncbi:MAG: amidohydrolase family protein [Cyclobacteriaceae bacterium]
MKLTKIITLFLITACAVDNEEPYDLIISNVTLIDGTGKEAVKNTSIYIRGNQIAAINSEKVKQTANVIDGTDRYLVPGFFDCHVHTSTFKEDFPRLLHYGVTTIFVPGGSTCSDEYYAQMRIMGAQDSVPSPRVFHTSQHFTMEGRHPVKTYASSNWVEGETVFFLRDTAQIAALVRKVSQSPIKGIKLTLEDGPAPPFVERMPQEFVNKVADEARKAGTEVFAHVSDNIELAMALEAGIQNIIHYTGVDIDWEKDQELIASINQGELSWVTTLMIDKGFLYALHPEWMEIPEIAEIYDSEEIEKLKNPVNIRKAKEFLDFLINDYGIKDPTLENIISPQVSDIKRLYESEVNMVLGTDTGNDFIFPGYSLHEEMQLLELGGMDPLDIIKMGTLNASRMLKVSDRLGSIEEGKIADMVLLDKNPLESIQNTLSINTVIKNGKIQKRLN